MDYQKRRQVTQIVADPLTRQRRAIYWILGVAMILGLLLALSSSAVSIASAAPSLKMTSVILEGGAP